jgi:hypothetical protein
MVHSDTKCMGYMGEAVCNRCRRLLTTRGAEAEDAVKDWIDQKEFVDGECPFFEELGRESVA